VNPIRELLEAWAGRYSNARSSIRGHRIIVDELSFKAFLDDLVSPVPGL
jgi:hypothetical protein